MTNDQETLESLTRERDAALAVNHDILGRLVAIANATGRAFDGTEGLAEYVARLRGELEEARTVLRRYRWDDTGPYRLCRGCWNGVDDGCSLGCEIARALGERSDDR